MFKLVAKYTFIRPVATDTLGHWDVYMACLPQISAPHGPTCHMCVGIIQHLLVMMARLGPMMWWRDQVLTGSDLRHADLVQWGRPASKEVIKQA